MIIGSSSATTVKSREEDGVITTPLKVVYNNDEVWNETTYDPPARLQRNEYIAYDRGHKVYFKNCVHVQDKLVTTGHDSVRSQSYYGSPGIPLTVTSTPAATLPWVFGTNVLTLPEASDVEERINGLLTKDQLNDLLAMGFRRMVPRIDQLTENFNALSFLYELKDIRDMFRLWSRNESLVRNLSSGVLNWNLGWRPFVADCERLIFKVMTLRDKIKQWNADAAKGVIYTRHANVTPSFHLVTGIDSSNSSIDDRVVQSSTHDIYHPVSGANLGPGRAYYEKADFTEWKFITHLMFKPKALDLRFIEDHISLWYDALSLGETGSIIWNAIPFSFVVDYFWSIGDFLEQFEVEATTIGFDLVDFGYSLKKVKTQHRTYWFGDDADVTKWALGSRGLVEKTYVRRRAHIPASVNDTEWSSLWDLHLPSWHQAWIGVNLLNVLR